MVIAAQNPVHSVLYPDPRLRQRGGAVRAAGRRVPGDDPGRRLCRRGRGAVPVRGDDARRRLRRAARRASCNICRSARWSAASFLAELLLVVGAWSHRRRACRSAITAPIPPPTSPTPRRSAACSTRKYVYYFQAAGLVLLVAMIGAIVLTLRHKAGVKRQNIADQVARTQGDRDRESARCVRARDAGRHRERRMTIGLGHYLTVAAILFTLGIFGIFLNRKNVIVILMSIELILLAVNINLVAFSRLPRRPRRPGVRAAGADRRGGRSRDRACHPRRLFPQPRLDRGRRHQPDEGLSVGCIRRSSSCRCSAPSSRA